MSREPTASFKIFSLVWFGQVISLLGSGLTRFALGVWVFRESGSVTYFALISLCGFLPGILISPIAGVLVDRWSRRKVMIASDLGSGLMTLVVVALLWSDSLAIWHIYILVGVAAIFEAFQWPAYFAAMTLLVPEKQLGRANGMVQFGQSAAEIIAPLAAGFLMFSIGLEGIVFIDCITFLVAVSTLVSVRFPEPESDPSREKSSIWAEAAVGWRYIRTPSRSAGALAPVHRAQLLQQLRHRAPHADDPGVLGYLDARYRARGWRRGYARW